MSEYINVKKTIYVPLKPVIVKFHEKEEVELNAFQKFILEAVESNATVEQMVDATQLTKNVVESQLLQMEGQKLLVRKEDTIELSELSKNILMISKSVVALNDEKKIMCINLITNDIERYDANIYCDIKKDDFVMKEKIRSKDIVGIGIEDNISFFQDYMDTFNNLSKEQIDKILSSIYVEFNELDKKIVYKSQEICKLPCLIGDDNLKLEENAYAEGKCSVITINVSTNKVEKYREQIKNIKELYADAPELISDLGRDFIKEFNICEKYNKENLTFVYDYESGKIREGKYSIEDTKNKRTQLILKSEKKIDDKIESQVINVVKGKWGLDEKYHIKMTNVKEYVYKVGFFLEELLGDNI